MPHDRNGKEVKKGDLVSVVFEVVDVYSVEDYCNVSLKAVKSQPTEVEGHVTLNARQATLVEE